MTHRNHNTEKVKENPHQVEVKQLYNDASAQIMHITLQPGEKLKAHKTPVDVVFYILEGQPTIHIGEESKSFAKDDLIESPAQVVHFISNESSAAARIMVIKAPRPETSTKIL